LQQLIRASDDEEYFARKDADFAGVLPVSQEQLSGPFTAFFVGMDGQNWLFLNHPCAHAQIFVNSLFHCIEAIVFSAARF
jgi:hypothetical protein